MASELKVENISHTNGTAAVTIDDSGRVLHPAKPAWRVSIATNQVVNISANTTVNWTALDFDIGNNFDLSNNYYTIPVTGLYHINAQVSLEEVANSTNTYIYVVVNGSGLYIGGLNDPQGGNNTAPNYSSVHQFTTGDEISIMARAVSDTNCIIRQYTSYFSGYLVG